MATEGQLGCWTCLTGVNYLSNASCGTSNNGLDHLVELSREVAVVRGRGSSKLLGW